MGRESGPGLQLQTDMRIIALFSLLFSLAPAAGKDEEEGKLRIFPSDNELVLRNFEDGTYKWVYEKDGQLRAEVEGPDGVKRGVYTVAGADGQIKTQAYISGGNQGHRLVEFGELGIDLPPLPYNLHPKAGQRKFPVANEEDEQTEENSIEGNVVNAKSHPVHINPFGIYKEEVKAVVIEAADTNLGQYQLGDYDNSAVGALAGPPALGGYHAGGGPNIVNYNTNNHLLYNPQI